MEVVTVDADITQCKDLCVLMEQEFYNATPLHSIKDLEKHIQSNDCQAVILDIDTISVNNRSIRILTKQNPGIHFLCLSKNLFHPDLKEALSNYIDACIKKPIDPDELLFWLKSIKKAEEY